MTTNEQTTLQDRCARCDCAESTMDETRQTARAIADMTSEAYRCDVVTGNAPGITLADLIETAIRERDEKHAEEQETQRALTRAAEQRAAKAEAQERYLTERIHGTAEGGGIVRRVEVLEAALRGLVEAAQVLASSHAEMHDNVILLETVDEPADRAICAARAALEVEP